MSSSDNCPDGFNGRPASLCATASLFSSASPTSSSHLPTPDVLSQSAAPHPPRSSPLHTPAIAASPPATNASTRSPLYHQPQSHTSVAPDSGHPRPRLSTSSRPPSFGPSPSPPRSFLQPPSSRLSSPYDTDDVSSAASVYNARYRHTWRGIDSTSTAQPDSFYDPHRSPSLLRERHLWHIWPERSNSAPLSSEATSSPSSPSARYTAAPPVPLAAHTRAVDSPEIAAGMRWLHTGHSWPQLWQPEGRAHHGGGNAAPQPGRRTHPSLAHILLPPPLLSDFASTTELATTTEEADRSTQLPPTREQRLDERQGYDGVPSSMREGEVYTMHTNPMSGMELAVESPSGMDTFMNSSMASDWALHPSAVAAQDAARTAPLKLMAEIAPLHARGAKHGGEDSPREHCVAMPAVGKTGQQDTAHSTQQQWQPYEAADTESFLMRLPRPFYRLRWAAMYYNPLCWPLWNGCTVGEAAATGLILAQMAVTVFWWAADPAFRVDVAVTGQMSVFLLMLTCFMAVHSNVVLLLLFGLPFDRQLPWHKLLALSTVVHSTLHLLAFYIGGRADTMPDAHERYHLFDLWNRAYGMEVSGWMLFAPIIAMSTLGIPWLARRCYAAFFKTHVIMAAATLVGVAFHGFGAAVTAGIMPLAIPGGLLWLLDLALRAAFGTRLTNEKNATLRLVRPTVEGGAPLVAVSLPHTGGRRYTAGQWVFLCVPRLGLLHWHPFTIASSGHDSNVELAIACKGPWTLRLAELAASETSVKAYVEGPYGAPMVDVHGGRYKCFLLISGGIGWTFLRSWRRQLLQDAQRGRPVKSVTTVAVVRATDQHHMPEITDTLNPEAAVDTMEMPAGLRLEEHVFLTGARPPDVMSRSELRKAFAGGYVGGPGVPVSSTSINGVPMSSTSVLGFSTKWGRPQFQDVLYGAAQAAHAAGETRVAMLICGTQEIVNSCRHSVHLDGSDIAFDIHYEVLAF